jgi:hypothetical protein
MESSKVPPELVESSSSFPTFFFGSFSLMMGFFLATNIMMKFANKEMNIEEFSIIKTDVAIDFSKDFEKRKSTSNIYKPVR